MCQTRQSQEFKAEWTAQERPQDPVNLNTTTQEPPTNRGVRTSVAQAVLVGAVPNAPIAAMLFSVVGFKVGSSLRMFYLDSVQLR